MRLRLHVQRHQLPRVSLLWSVPDPENPTVAELLEHVNDLIPLEAEGWGLEDYAVEVDGFEGLHYMQLHNILRDEDEVNIRPLQTNDIRARTLGGRHQISADGRHLVDGVAFGRPLLRRISHPPIRIPPRKRRRLQIEAEEDIHTHELAPAVAQNTNIALLDAAARNVEQSERGRSKPKRVTFSDVESSDTDDDEEPAALPSSDDDEEEDEDFSMESSDSEVDSDSSSNGINSGAITPTGKELVLAEDHNEDEDSSDTDSDSSSASSSDADSSDSSSESDGESSDSSESESEEETLPIKKITQQPKGATAIKTADSSEIRAVVAKPPKTTGKRSAEQKTDSTKQPPKNRTKLVEEAANPQRVKEPSSQVTVPMYEGKSSTKSRNTRRRVVKKLQHLKEKGILPPNATPEELRMYEAQEQANGGALPADGADGQGRSDLRASEARWRYSGGTEHADTEEDVQMVNGTTGDFTTQDKQSDKESADDEFRRKRQALLDAIQAGGVDVSAFGSEAAYTPQSPSLAASSFAPQSSEPTPAETTENGVDEDEGPEVQSSRTQVSTKKNVYTEEEVLAAEKAATEKAAKERSGRARLDVTASQRLLFGSLGVRRPRDAADREKVKQKLATQSQRKPVASAKLEAQPEPAAEEEPEPSSSNAWKTKINLSAVECCDEDVVLSTPPFPFYQRWDPQQQRQKKRKRASNTYAIPRKSRASNQHADAYYAEDDTGENWGYDEYPEESCAENGYSGEPSDPAAAQLLQETSAAQEQQGVVAEQEEADDFPSLPTDLTTLPLLDPKEVTKDDVILFSRLEVSAATNWTPAQSPVRTARVLDILPGRDGEAKTLELQLAKRDLPRKVYDEHGKRVYSKFEMQADDEDEYARFLTVEWSELCDVRVLEKAGVVAVGGATVDEAEVNGNTEEERRDGAGDEDEALMAGTTVDSAEREASVEL